MLAAVAFLTPRLQTMRMARIRPLVRGRVLDLGCHRARIYEELGGEIDRYCGVDMDAALIEENRARFSDARFEIRNLDDDDLDLDEEFDVVLMVALIEHLFNQKHMMAEVARALAPDGRVLITSPTPIGNDFVHRNGSKVGLFARDAADDHAIVFNRHRLGLLAQEVGLTMESHKYFQLGCNQFAVLRHP